MTTSNAAVSTTESVSRSVSVPVGRQKTEQRKTDIKIEKTDGRIEKIIVRCCCGEETTIDCSYES